MGALSVRWLEANAGADRDANVEVICTLAMPFLVFYLAETGFASMNMQASHPDPSGRRPRPPAATSQQRHPALASRFQTRRPCVQMSGVLAVVCYGLVFASPYGKVRIDADVEHFLHEFWAMVGHLVNTLIFILSGALILLKLLTLTELPIQANEITLVLAQLPR